MRSLLSFLLFALPIMGLGVLTPDRAYAQAAPSEAWKTLERFENKGRVETKPFTVDAEKWRIKWTSTSKIPGGMGHVVQIYVLHPDSDQPRRVAANATNQKTLSGTSKTFPSGRYALKIHGLNGDWTVKVQVPK